MESIDKLVINQQKEKNPSQKTLFPQQQQRLTSESFLETSSNDKKIRQNDSSYTYSKNEQQNIKKTELPVITENAGLKKDDSIFYENKKIITTTTTTTTNVNNMNIKSINNFGGNRRVEENDSNNLNETNTNVQGTNIVLNNNSGPTNLNNNINEKKNQIS